MKKLLAKIRKILHDRRTRRFLTRFVSGVAALVVFVTTYALVLPAITMEKEANCGIEAHQHDDSCYTEELICDIPESDGHHHDESCYSTTSALVCETEEHEHSTENGCYDDEGNLICEVMEHRHNEECYEEVRELTCQIPESEGHHHTEDCYEKVLTCGKEVHVHSTACYEDDPVSDAAVAASTSSAAAATTSAGSVSSAGMTLNFEGDIDKVVDFDETVETDKTDDIGFVDNSGSDETNGSSETNGTSEIASSVVTSTEAASDTEVTYGRENAGTGRTETSNSALTNADNSATALTSSADANQYIPQLDAVDFNTVLNNHTGIYYYRAADEDIVEDSSAIPAEDWDRIPNNIDRINDDVDDVELGNKDLLRVYLSYTIPAGSLNATNPVARYRLPSNLHLTDPQVKAINENVNGLAGQYVDMSTLEITDPDKYNAYLGVEAVEGTRRPDEAVEDYLAEQARKAGKDAGDATEYISAVVRVENVYDADGLYGEKDAYLGQDLIFTFAPYSIEKNQHEYDSTGKPTKAGEEIKGWFTFDLNMGQVDFEEPEITTSTAEETSNIEDYVDGDSKSSPGEDENTEENHTANVQTEDDHSEDDLTKEASIEDGQKYESNEENHSVNNTTVDVNTADNESSEDGKADDNQDHAVTIERAERTAEIIFVEVEWDGKDKKTDQISTTLTAVEETVFEAQNDDKLEDVEDPSVSGEKERSAEENEGALSDEATADGNVKDPVDTEQVIMPAMSFNDSIKVSTGKPAGIDENAGSFLANAAESLPEEAEVSVRVEADEGTFPAGTTMVLSAVDQSSYDTLAETLAETVESRETSDTDISDTDTSEAKANTQQAETDNAEDQEIKQNTEQNNADNNTNIKTYGFQAVDITFFDKDGNEIEPAKPVRVALTSKVVEQAREKAEESAIADPVVVHVDNEGKAEQMDLVSPEEVEPAKGRSEEEMLEEAEKTAESGKTDNADDDISADDASGKKDVEHKADSVDESASAVSMDTDEAEESSTEGITAQEDRTVEEDGENRGKSEFTADSFSVYAIVYTVELYTNIITDSGETYRISVTYDETSGIPQDAELKVKEIKEGDKGYEDYYTEAVKAASESSDAQKDASNNNASGKDNKRVNPNKTYARFFDIEIWANGEKIEPARDVSVSIRLLDVPERDDRNVIKVVHFDQDDIEIIPHTAAADHTEGVDTTKDRDDKQAENNVHSEMEFNFTASSFSVYSVVSYTVDFHWEVDGEMFEYSIPGGGFVSFRRLIEILGIIEKNDTSLSLSSVQVGEETKTFVENVDALAFSDPGLVWVGKIDEESTVGAVKDLNGLEVEYSEELTDEQIAEINAQTVEAGDWVLISLLPFATEETLTVTMKDGEVFTISVTDAQLKKTVISDSGETWEITVSFGEDALIPADSELQVRELTEDDENYSSLCENAQSKLQQEGTELQKPVLFDISIVSNGEKIEPAENSNVKVEVKLVRSALRGIYTDEESPLLVNDEPLTQKNGEIAQNVQVIHQLNDGAIELVDTEDAVGEEDVTSSFTTNSFSDWLLFLDETVENITIGVNDTLTLRPYSKWVWKSSEELEEYAHYEWSVPQNSNVITFNRERKYDDQLREEYYFYHGAATQTGQFDIELKEGNVVKHTIHVTVVPDVDDLPPTIDQTVDLKVNLFDYDVPYQKSNGVNIPNTFDFTHSGDLDARGNTAGSSYSNTINNNHNLKFLGWGGGNVSGWNINNYSQDVPNQGILQGRLTNGFPTLSTSGNQSLDYLFDTDSKNHSVYAFPGVNGLFQRDGNGYYYYNSNSNYAYYLPNSNSFTLYTRTYSQWTQGTGGHNAKPIGFFPFHRYDSYLKEGNVGMNFNTNLNHHFGMSMTVDFEIPSDGLDEYGNPIVFEFSGDDDMWVFIDDNLVLDVGGIHQPVPGKINFSSNTVEVFGKTDTTITQRFTDAGSPKAWAIGDGKPHTMKIFYLERGGCDSNLSIKFNTPILYGKGKLSLVKREKNKTTPLKDAKFGIWNNAKCQGDPIVECTTNDNGEIDFGEFALKSATDTFYLKEIEQPDGYVRDPEVYQIKPRLNNGVAVKDSNGYVVLDVLDKNGTSLEKVQNDKVVFPNTRIETISIPAEKKWIGGSGGNASVTLTIKRFKLIDKVKGFMIVKELWGEPDDYTFSAVYKITYPDGTQKTVNYSDFINGAYGIADAVPGAYLIEEEIISTAPAGYHMEHTSQSLNVTLEEDGTALAFFKTTFNKDMGKLYIKENVTVQNGNPSDIDYSTVRYAVLDESGKKVTSVSHTQAAAGISLDLPVGTYSVKAVSVPDEPYNYERTEQYVVSGSNRQNGTFLKNISITKNNQTRVDFNTKYVKLNNAQNCKWAIRDQYPPYNKPNYVTGKVDYPVGTKLMMTFKIPQSQVYNTNGTYDVSYNGQSLTASVSNVQTNYEFEVEFTVVENAELVFRVNGIPDYSGNKNVTIDGPRFEVIEHAPHIYSNKMMLSAKRPNASASLSRSAQISATHPEAPEGKKYVKDSTWSKTVELNSGKNWKDNTTLKDLPATDDEGNKYYYYVASVQESGVPEGTVCSIDLDGENILLIGKDLNSGETLSVTNTLTGSLKITKEVTVNRTTVTDHSKACPADGKYTFTITKDGSPIDQSPVEITITNGVAKTTEVENLLPGTYRVTENQQPNGTELDKINGTEAAQNYFDIVVQTGKTGDTAPNVTFTNNIVDTKIKVVKVDQETQNPLPGAKFKLTRVDERGNEISTAGEAYTSELEVDPTTGELEFTGLKKGHYKLEETHVPDGYIKKEQFYFITIGKDGTGALDTAIPHEMISPESGDEFTVENEPGVALPNTGGSGTQLFTILGSILILGAGVLLWRRRRLI